MTKRNLKLIFEEIAFEYGFKKHRYMYIKEYDKFLLKISLQNILESNEYRFNCYCKFVNEIQKIRGSW